MTRKQAQKAAQRAAQEKREPSQKFSLLARLLRLLRK